MYLQIKIGRSTEFVYNLKKRASLPSGQFMEDKRYFGGIVPV